MPLRSNKISTSNHQRGIALVLSLVFLLLLTMIGIAALNTTALEEKMTNNVKDRNLAFQAAESALILAESWIYTQIGKPVFPNVSAGLYLPDTGVSGDPDGVDNWNENIWSGSNVVTYPNKPGASGSGSLGKIQTQPRYILEDMGEVPESGGSVVTSSNYKSSGSTVLRITARGTGGTDAAVVMVQSTYLRAF